jgi:hypothetical protein
MQGAPLSVYMRYSAVSNLTVYVMSHRVGDASINALQDILNTAVQTVSINEKADVLLGEPFDIAVILSMLSFETSKYHVKRFQRFMWTQVGLTYAYVVET